jgi:arginase
MTAIAVPYHLDERLAGFDPVLPAVAVAPEPVRSEDPWVRLAAVHAATADAVAATADATPLLVAGDCIACVGAVAGLQRRGVAPGIVWFDAHPDFHTEQSSTSGYLAGMPLALAAGLGTRTLPDALGLAPVPYDRILAVDGRDTDAGELQLLEEHGVPTVATDAVDETTLPAGPLYVHVDVDVLDPAEVGPVRYPVEGGPTLDALTAALERILATGRVAGITLASVWRPEVTAPPQRPEILRRLAAALGAAG